MTSVRYFAKGFIACSALLLFHGTPNGDGLDFPGFVCTSRDSGASWIKANLPDDFWHVGSSADGNKLVAAGGTAIYTWQATPQISAPILNIGVSVTNLILYWAGSPSFAVLETSDLRSGTWTQVSVVPIQTNQEYQVLLPLPASNRFYRLISQ